MNEKYNVSKKKTIISFFYCVSCVVTITSCTLDIHIVRRRRIHGDNLRGRDKVYTTGLYLSITTARGQDGHHNCPVINSLGAGTVFIRQNLTDVRF